MLFGAIGTLLGIVRGVPQLARMMSRRDPHGVSIDSAATAAVVSSGWAVYGLMTSQPAVTLATGSSAVIFFSITVAGWRLGRRLTELRTAPLWLLVLGAVGTSLGTTALGFALAGSVLVANTPQVVTAFRERDLSGLSAGTWGLSMADGAVWLAYAIAAGDRAIVVYGVLQLSTSAVIVARRLAWKNALPGAGQHGTPASTEPAVEIGRTAP